MPDGEIQQLKKVFESLDAGGDGRLTVAEVMEGVRNAGLKEVPEELEIMLKSVDSDGSGQIDYTEFLAACLERRQYIQEDRMWSAFRVFDTDVNGKISKKELGIILAGGKLDDVCKTNVESIMEVTDKDGDGEISFEEFVTMMKAE
jgi:calcium-dependent protein kinase